MLRKVVLMVFIWPYWKKVANYLIYVTLLNAKKGFP